MQFGLFGSAAARRGGPEFDSSEGFRDFIEYNVEAEALGLSALTSGSLNLCRIFLAKVHFNITSRPIELTGRLGAGEIASIIA